MSQPRLGRVTLRGVYFTWEQSRLESHSRPSCSHNTTQQQQQQQVWQTFPPNGAKGLLGRLQRIKGVGSFPVKTGVKPFCSLLHLSTSSVSVWLTLKMKNSFPPAVFAHPKQCSQPRSGWYLWYGWSVTCVQVCPPQPLVWDQHVAWPWPRSACSVSIPPSACPFWFLNPFSVVVVFWVLRVTVSSVSVSGEKFPLWVQAGYATGKRDLSLQGCCWCLGNDLLFIYTFNQGLKPYLWRWWHEKKKYLKCV